MAILTRACPVLAARDPSAAADWYRDKLGFSVSRNYPDEGYAIVQRDEIEIHFWKCDDRHIAENTSAYIRVSDIAAIHASFEQAGDGGRISTIEDRAWGMREFYVWDPDGNLMRIGEQIPSPRSKSPDLLAELEQLPPEELRRLIGQAAAVLEKGTR